ncbi:MFS transporter [Escherichia coli]|uniref:MFS transporter n=1 Tax=Escherichia coli TaxID=562 RepID=UPI00388DD2FF
MVCFLTNSGFAKYLLWIITGMLVMFAPFFILSSDHCYNTTTFLVGSIVGVHFILAFVLTPVRQQ